MAGWNELLLVLHVVFEKVQLLVRRDTETNVNEPDCPHKWILITKKPVQLFCRKLESRKFEKQAQSFAWHAPGVRNERLHKHDLFVNCVNHLVVSLLG